MRRVVREREREEDGVGGSEKGCERERERGGWGRG